MKRILVFILLGTALCFGVFSRRTEDAEILNIIHHGYTVGLNSFGDPNGFFHVPEDWADFLDDFNSITPNDGTFIVGDGTDWVGEILNTAATSMGLGTGDSVEFAALTVDDIVINNNAITVSSDLTIAANADDMDLTAVRITLQGSGEGVVIEALTFDNETISSASGITMTAGDEFIVTAGEALSLTTPDFATFGSTSSRLNLIALGSADVNVLAADEIILRSGGDSDDYISIDTVANQTTINFVGQNGKITADSGTIDFDDENRTGTGTHASGAATVTGQVFVNQAAHSLGLQVSGFSAQSGEFIKLYVDTNGETFFETDSLLNMIIDGSFVGFWTSSQFAFFDDKIFRFGQSDNSASFKWSTVQTNEGLMLGLNDINSANNRYFIICDKSDLNFDFEHPIQNHPTVFIHSSNQQTDEWISLIHDSNNGIIDVGTGTLHLPATNIGNPGTTELTIEADGDTFWEGSGTGLSFAEIHAKGAGEDIDFSGGAGEGNKQQITAFDTDGEGNNMTPDHTSDHITVVKAGIYLCTVSITIDSQAGQAAQFHFSLFKNDGGTEFPEVHVHRNLPAGAGGNGGSVSLSGLVTLAASDTMEIWAWNATNTQDVTIDAINLSLVQIGGV